MPEHLAAIEVQPAQAVELGGVDLAQQGRALVDQGPAWTMTRGGEGSQVIACGGIIEHSFPHVSAWTLISGEIGAGELQALTRAIQRVLSLETYARIDTLVQSGFARGCSWARRLGFAHEGTQRKWGPMSIDMELYARIRGDG